MNKSRAVAKEPRPSTKLEKAVTNYRSAHARLFTKCMTLGFAEMRSKMRAEGINTEDPRVQAAIEHYAAGNLGFDRDHIGDDEEARVVGGFFKLCGFKGPDYLAEAAALATQPWRSVVGDLVQAVDGLLLVGRSLKLETGITLPLHELLSELCVYLPDHREINPCRPSIKAMELAQRGLAICSRILDVARSRAGGDGDLSDAALQVLRALPASDAKHSIRTLGDIAGKIRCDRSTVSRAMKELKGYVPPLAVSARRNYRRTPAGDREAERRDS